MAVTLNTGSALPISGNETSVATIVGGPFDTVSVYAIGGVGGNGNSGLIRYRLYALVGGFQTLVAQCSTLGSNTSQLLEWVDVDVLGGPSQDVEAGGTAYTLTVQDTGPSGTPRDPVTVTLAGVNAFDTAPEADFGSSLTLLPGQEGFLPALAGYAQKMDVAVDQTRLPPVRVRVYANCGPGSIQAIVRNKAISGQDTTIASVFRAIQLPAATQYLVSLTNESQNTATATLTASSYSTAITAGGVVILGGDTTGPSNANTVTKWRNVALDPVTMAAPTDAQIPVFDAALAEWRSISLSGGATINNAGVVTTAAIALAGDVTGPSGANTVIKVNGATVPVGGALTTGNALLVTGASTLGYGAINLAGGANFITGLLPTGNQSPQAMAGDVTGTTAASVVAKVNGATVPVGGALTPGNVLQVSGAGALTYAPIDLNNSNSVTGGLFGLMTQRRFQYYSGGFIGNAAAGFVNCSLNFFSPTTTGNVIPGTKLGATNRNYCSNATAGQPWIGANDGALNTGSFQRGSGAGAGGFTVFTRFAIEDGFATTAVKVFVGLVGNTGPGSPTTSTDFSTQTLQGSFGLGTTQTLAGGVYAGNWQIFNNTAGSAPTVTDTGIPIVINHIYDFTIFCAPDSATMTWTILDTTTATSATGTIGANLPSNLLGLLWQAGMSFSGGGPTNSFTLIRYVTDAQ
jgi:hypothetical protein